MLSLEERKIQFEEALRYIQERYGFQLGTMILPRPLGPVLQVEAQLTLVPIEGWKPPNEQVPDNPTNSASLEGYTNPLQ